MSLKRLVANAEASASKAAKHADTAIAAANTCQAAANMAVAERISNEAALAHLRAQADRFLDWWDLEDYSDSDDDSKFVKGKRKGFRKGNLFKGRGQGSGKGKGNKPDAEPETGFAETVVDQLKSLSRQERERLEADILVMVGQSRLDASQARSSS